MVKRIGRRGDGPPPYRRRCISLLLYLLAVLCLRTRLAAETRPNILLIIADDQRFDTVGEYMPFVQTRIFDQGVAFSNAYVTTSLCCPSRSSILTGLYARHHGVKVNRDRLTQSTMVNRLHSGGYFTGLVGKYLNTWNGTPRSEFDFWVSFPYGVVHYNDPVLFDEDQARTFPGYVTERLRDEALDFLGAAKLQRRPFFLIFAPNAPHGPADPAAQDEALYQGLAPWSPPGARETDLSDKPDWLRAAAFNAEMPRDFKEEFRRRQLRTLAAVDRAVQSLFSALEAAGDLENTMVIYTSDNGVMWGEHGLSHKAVVYEEAIRTPLGIRFPHGQYEGLREDSLAANIDLAPTILELSGAAQPSAVDGRSLLDLLAGKGAPWRSDLLIEGYRGEGPGTPFTAIHSRRFVYVENEGDIDELYDLLLDPYQLDNQSGNAELAELEEQLRRRLYAVTGRTYTEETDAEGQDDGYTDSTAGEGEAIDNTIDALINEDETGLALSAEEAQQAAEVTRHPGTAGPGAPSAGSSSAALEDEAEGDAASAAAAESLEGEEDISDLAAMLQGTNRGAISAAGGEDRRAKARGPRRAGKTRGAPGVALKKIGGKASSSAEAKRISPATQAAGTAPPPQTWLRRLYQFVLRCWEWLVEAALDLIELISSLFQK